MSSRTVIYWSATAVTAFVFLSGGLAYLAGASFAIPGVLELGYPRYFITFLGAWKVLGGLAILAPGFPRLKEWAYAGMVFDLTAAIVSHWAVGHAVIKAIAPVVFLGAVWASAALRPVGRKAIPAAGLIPQGVGA